jgi:hypothetical protein
MRGTIATKWRERGVVQGAGSRWLDNTVRLVKNPCWDSTTSLSACASDCLPSLLWPTGMLRMVEHIHDLEQQQGDREASPGCKRRAKHTHHLEA